MIVGMRTALGTQVLIDQIMAALSEGECTTAEIAARVKTVHCVCANCRGRARACYSEDLYPILCDLARDGKVVGTIGPNSAPDGNVATLTWRRA